MTVTAEQSHPASYQGDTYSVSYQPACGDVDIRVRTITGGLSLRSVLWKYDANDWKVGTHPNVNIAIEFVDAQYQQMIDDGKQRDFADVRL